QATTVPVTTLKELCRQYAPPAFDFLKVDVEGAEPDVLLNGDWRAYPPKGGGVEGLAPYTLAPARGARGPFPAEHRYRYVLFDSLNRYYLAEEASDLAPCFADAPATFDTFQFRNVKPALSEAGHPDHHLAVLISRTAMTHLPLLERDVLFE